MTTTPISFEWHDDYSATIHRGGQSWAKLRYEDGWYVTPLLVTSDGHREEGRRELVTLDRDDRETAALDALRIVTRPDFRPPPHFATDPVIWEHVKQKNPLPYDEWGPKDFAAANRIYGFSLRKYGALNPDLAARYGVSLEAA